MVYLKKKSSAKIQIK